MKSFVLICVVSATLGSLTAKHAETVNHTVNHTVVDEAGKSNASGVEGASEKSNTSDAKEQDMFSTKGCRKIVKMKYRGQLPFKKVIKTKCNGKVVKKKVIMMPPPMRRVVRQVRVYQPPRTVCNMLPGRCSYRRARVITEPVWLQEEEESSSDVDSDDGEGEEEALDEEYEEEQEEDANEGEDTKEEEDEDQSSDSTGNCRKVISFGPRRNHRQKKVVTKICRGRVVKRKIVFVQAPMVTRQIPGRRICTPRRRVCQTRPGRYVTKQQVRMVPGSW